MTGRTAEELQEVVAESYGLFRRYKATAPLGVCTACCITPQQEFALLSMGVRQIPFELLYDYNTAARAVEPRIEEFKHFLPRFLEFTAQFRLLHHSAEIILSRFTDHPAERWTKDERALVQRFGLLFLRACLSQYPAPNNERINAYLIMVWKAKVDLLPILAEWCSAMDVPRVLHAGDLLDVHGDPGSKCSSAFADPEYDHIIRRWLETPLVKARVQEVVEKTILNIEGADEQTMSDLSAIHDRIVTRI